MEKVMTCGSGTATADEAGRAVLPPFWPARPVAHYEAS